MLNRETRRKLDLLSLLIKKEVTLKHKRTVLGILWSLINPLLMTAVLFFAFKIIMRFGMDDYTFFLLSALFPWTWFSSSISMSGRTLIGNVNLIKRVNFPRHFLVIATVMGQFVNFIFCIPILVGFAYFYKKSPGINWLIGIPILILIQSMLTIGLSLVISMVNAYFRDMEYLIGVLLNMLWWLTPILYPLETIPETYRVYFSFNPLAYLIASWRDLFMSNTIDWGRMGLSFSTSLVFLSVGIILFQRLGKRLDEVL